MKKLVAYFSASGVTQRVATRLAEALGAQLHEIQPQVKYTREDLNWQNASSRSSVEMKDPNSRPAICDDVLDMSQYDVVYVGFPIWWYVAPTIINTFLEKHNFSGKTIVLFATSGGSGFGNTVSRLKPSVDATTRIVEGKVLSPSSTVADLKAWADKLGL